LKKIPIENSNIFTRIIKYFGRFGAFVNILLPFVILLDVLLRYLFSISFPWLFELEWHFFGMIFLLGAAQTYLIDKHVRVDLFYSKWGKNKKDWIDITGDIVFLIPFCLVGIYFGLKFSYSSFLILESSPDPGGLPLRFIIKSFIPLMFLTLLIQAILNLKEKFQNLRSADE
jgi:TRAP-type mannitol/chloroaromatic compound transport system permease small subunit